MTDATLPFISILLFKQITIDEVSGNHKVPRIKLLDEERGVTLGAGELRGRCYVGLRGRTSSFVDRAKLLFFVAFCV